MSEETKFWIKDVAVPIFIAAVTIFLFFESGIYDDRQIKIDNQNFKIESDKKEIAAAKAKFESDTTNYARLIKKLAFDSLRLTNDTSSLNAKIKNLNFIKDALNGNIAQKNAVVAKLIYQKDSVINAYKAIIQDINDICTTEKFTLSRENDNLRTAVDGISEERRRLQHENDSLRFSK